MTVNIARCSEHGLHGERAKCFVCGGPVEQVPMVPCDAPAVERVAREMASWSGPVPVGVDGFRPFAEKALRAAGETP